MTFFMLHGHFFLYRSGDLTPSLESAATRLRVCKFHQTLTDPVYKRPESEKCRVF